MTHHFPCATFVGEENLGGEGFETDQLANLTKTLGSHNHPPGCCKVHRSLHTSNIFVKKYGTEILVFDFVSEPVNFGMGLASSLGHGGRGHAGQGWPW